jgi:hypothetical protein
MTNVVKFISRGADSLQNKVFGNPSTSNVLSQILDPARKLRNISDKGGGINTTAFLDPNNVLTSANTTTDASKTANALAKQHAITDPLTPPNADNAANAAQSNIDAMRRRRGILANLYGGGSKSTLG